MGLSSAFVYLNSQLRHSLMVHPSKQNLEFLSFTHQFSLINDGTADHYLDLKELRVKL